MIFIEITFTGTAELNSKLKKILRQFPAERSRFLAMEAEIIKGRTKQLTPVDTGFLRAGWNSQKIAADAVAIYNNVEYAPFVEYPTRQMAWGRFTGRVRAGRYMLRRAIEQSQAQFAVDANKILSRLLQ